MILKHLFEGGPFFMSLIYLMWIGVFFMVIRLFFHLKKNQKPPAGLSRQNENILFLGSFAFLFGILAQVIGFFQAFGVIAEMGDISPALIAGGLQVSLLAPLYGFVLFLISGITWFFFRKKLRNLSVIHHE